MAFCTNCGSPVESNHDYCFSCGSRIAESPTAEQAVAKTVTHGQSFCAVKGLPIRKQARMYGVPCPHCRIPLPSKKETVTVEMDDRGNVLSPKAAPPSTEPFQGTQDRRVRDDVELAKQPMRTGTKVFIGAAVVVTAAALLGSVIGSSSSHDATEMGAAAESATTSAPRNPSPPATVDRGPEAPIGNYVTGMRLNILQAAERSSNPGYLTDAVMTVYYTETCHDLNEMARNAEGLGNEEAKKILAAAVRWQQDHLGCGF